MIIGEQALIIPQCSCRYGGISELNQWCVCCGHPQCVECGVTVLHVKDGSKVLFNLRADENCVAAQNEALRQNNAALHETEQSLISSRAAPSLLENTADNQTPSRCLTSANGTQVTPLEPPCLRSAKTKPDSGNDTCWDDYGEGERTLNSSPSPSPRETATTVRSNSDSVDVFPEAENHSSFESFESLFASQTDSHSPLTRYHQHNTGLDASVWHFNEAQCPSYQVASQSDKAIPFIADGTTLLDDDFQGAESDGPYTFEFRAPRLNTNTSNWARPTGVANDTHTSDFSQTVASQGITTQTSPDGLQSFSLPYESSAFLPNVYHHQTVVPNYDQESSLAPPFSRSFSCENDEKVQYIFKEREFSQRDIEENRHDNKSIRACNSCRPTAEVDKKKPVACPFYKRYPEEHSRCMHKSFKNMSAFKQHLNSHANVKLKRVSNARVSFNRKWYWIWGRLFGETTTPPECPYPHAEKDLKDSLLHQSCMRSWLSQQETSSNYFNIPPTSQQLTSILETSTDRQSIESIHASTRNLDILSTYTDALLFDQSMHSLQTVGQSSRASPQHTYDLSSPSLCWDASSGDSSGTYGGDDPETLTPEYWETMETILSRPLDYKEFT
ncbi:hypothetical protein F5B20DRAFT_132085 [Whalleya microplaca]|nr:hypothetical protein F5B20DRAFT_132085 [Whalleya microplaca]